jgi:hypothetical protein
MAPSRRSTTSLGPHTSRWKSAGLNLCVKERKLESRCFGPENEISPVVGLVFRNNGLPIIKKSGRSGSRIMRELLLIYVQYKQS